MELHQRTLWEKRSFYLLPNKIEIFIKNTKGNSKNYVSYESLQGEVIVSQKSNLRLLFIAIALASFSACILLQTILVKQEIVYFLGALVVLFTAGVLYQRRQQNFIILKIHDRQKIVFLCDEPNSQAVEKFLTQLWLQRKKYLREKYFYINHDRDLDRQTVRLQWLLEQQVITKSEYRYAQEDWIVDRSCQSR